MCTHTNIAIFSTPACTLPYANPNLATTVYLPCSFRVKCTQPRPSLAEHRIGVSVLLDEGCLKNAMVRFAQMATIACKSPSEKTRQSTLPDPKEGRAARFSCNRLQRTWSPLSLSPTFVHLCAWPCHWTICSSQLLVCADV